MGSATVALVAVAVAAAAEVTAVDAALPVAALLRADADAGYVADTVAEPGCVLILIGTAQQLTKLYPLASGEPAAGPGAGPTGTD